MKIKRFVAKDMRSALAEIKEELGADAVIMSTKKIPEGVELMAAVDYNQAPSVAKETSTSLNAEHSQLGDRNRMITDDVVNIGSQPVQKNVNPNSNHQSNTSTSVNSNSVNNTAAEASHADSLSALLSRQVQQDPEKKLIDPLCRGLPTNNKVVVTPKYDIA